MTSITGVDTSGSAEKSVTSKSTLGTNFNTFLTMLTTQLKHQDPLSPMDSTQFTNQLVQFSSVEQQINANSNLEKLIKLQQATQTSDSISYLNQTVEVSGSKLPLQGGAAAFSYTLPASASSCEVQIRDSSGVLVYKTQADTAAGRHDLAWDGTDSSGEKQDDGLYTVSVVAKGVDGTPLTATTTVQGTVTKVTNDATFGAMLEIGAGDDDAKVTVTPDQVLSVTANNIVGNSQLLAANAQYQAALAQLQALEAAQAEAEQAAADAAAAQ
ncbi:flagellar hook assembly protein FlgD [Magnetospirillum sp. SS-4]|uniref:flagellar hook assembly protein FlgD n=1 Tax=Magnetospirillum sp. SS-4 TaxID=2681465 RepID=UPI00137C7574|nr:flagellar hook assembly protein FlgD [Magnetospirillum sp. SS-4]CAA7627501.1 Flagellar hook capping protein [Magnetospirillum sp. SS-4]